MTEQLKSIFLGDFWFLSSFAVVLWKQIFCILQSYKNGIALQKEVASCFMCHRRKNFARQERLYFGCAWQVRSAGEDVSDALTVQVDSTPPETTISSRGFDFAQEETTVDSITFEFEASPAALLHCQPPY